MDFPWNIIQDGVVHHVLVAAIRNIDLQETQASKENFVACLGGNFRLGAILASFSDAAPYRFIRPGEIVSCRVLDDRLNQSPNT